MEKPSYPLRKESPAVLASFPSLKRARQELKVRTLQYSKSGPLLDIREFLVTATESRFTKKGITLDRAQIQLLNKICAQWLEDNPDTTPTKGSP